MGEASTSDPTGFAELVEGLAAIEAEIDATT